MSESDDQKDQEILKVTESLWEKIFNDDEWPEPRPVLTDEHMRRVAIVSVGNAALLLVTMKNLAKIIDKTLAKITHEQEIMLNELAKHIAKTEFADSRPIAN